MTGKRRGIVADAVGLAAAFISLLRFPAILVAPPAGSDRLQRALLAGWQRDAGAGSALDELPRIALEIGGRAALARAARPRRAIVLALHGDAETRLLMAGHRL